MLIRMFSASSESLFFSFRYLTSSKSQVRHDISFDFSPGKLDLKKCETGLYEVLLEVVPL